MKKVCILFLFAGVFAWCQESGNLIKGKVAYLGTPLVNATVQAGEGGDVVKTGYQGEYQLMASEGEMLIYSYPGMRSVEILVEDVTQRLNVQLMPEINELDEVVVSKTVIKSQKDMRREYAVNKNIMNTAFGFVDKETTNFSMRILEGKDLGPIALDLATALQYRLPGIRVFRNGNDSLPSAPLIYLRGVGINLAPAIYDVDGLIMTDYPYFIDIQNIERLAVISGLGATVKYGGIGKGGLIVINTKGANFYKHDGQIPSDLAQLRGNTYDNDAVGNKALAQDVATYQKRLREASSLDDAKKVYSELSSIYAASYHFVLDAYEHFYTTRGATDFADAIIKEHKRKFGQDPVALKALAYSYQAQERFKEANRVYKEIFILRPNYIQSYMDMANAYRELGQYQKAIGLYARYNYLLDEGFLRAQGGLEVPLEREINNLVQLEGNELLTNGNLEDLVLEDAFDGTRLVFEWNHGEAEFELEFVNPEGRFFKSEHSILADADRIRDEKLSGISCEEYLIDGSIAGQWQVNVEYFGNKALTPTYLKATVYHNYGRPSQRKETKVFKLSLRNVKRQLFTVSTSSGRISTP